MGLCIWCACCCDDSASIFRRGDETVSEKGVNEVISCLDYYFNRTPPDKVETLNLYSDGCGGQNTNWFVIMYLYSLVKLGRIPNTRTLFSMLRGTESLCSTLFYSTLFPVFILMFNISSFLTYTRWWFHFKWYSIRASVRRISRAALCLFPK